MVEDDVISSDSSHHGTSPSLVDDASSSSSEAQYQPSSPASFQSSFAQTTIDTQLSTPQTANTKDWFQPVTPAGKDLITSPPRIPEKSARRKSSIKSYDETPIEGTAQVVDALGVFHQPPAQPTQDTETTQTPKAEVDTEAQTQAISLQKRGKRKVARQKYMMTFFLIGIK